MTIHSVGGQSAGGYWALLEYPRSAAGSDREIIQELSDENGETERGEEDIEN